MKRLLVLCACSVLCHGAISYDIAFTPDNVAYSPLNFTLSADDYLTPGVWALTNPVPLSFSDGQVTPLDTLVVRQWADSFELCFGNGIDFNIADYTVRQDIDTAVLGLAFNTGLPLSTTTLAGGYGGISWLNHGQGGVGTAGAFTLAVAGTAAPANVSFITPDVTGAEAPEPSTLFLSCLSIGGLIFFRRRSRRTE
jgi:hypothetical protein